MSGWKIIKENGWIASVAHAYTPEFPMEVRALLASWLEQNIGALDFDSDNPSHYEFIGGFVLQMVETFCKEAESVPILDESSYYYKQRLTDLASQMRVLYASDRMSLFKGFQQSLINEKQEIYRLQNASASSNGLQAQQPATVAAAARKPFESLDEQMTKEVEEAKLHCAFIENNIREIHSKTLDVQNLQYQQQLGSNNFNNFNLDMLMEDPAAVAAQLQRTQAEICQLQQQCGEIFVRLVQLLERISPRILEEIECFKDEQRLVALGKMPERNLSRMESWCTGIYDCLLSVNQSLVDFQNACPQLSPQHAVWIQNTLANILQLRNALISASFVIEVQPSQIIRKATKFGPIKLRLLISSININDKAVSAMLINEAQARCLFNNPNYIPDKPAENAVIKTAKNYPRVVKNDIEYKDIRISINRKAKRGEKTVVEVKFCIFFKVDINVPDYPQNYLYTTTLPITITSHPNQEGEAWGTILWDNAFAMKKRQPFEVPQEVPWSQLIEAINLRFEALSEERRGLTEENKSYLKEKCFRDVIPANEMVSWKQFAKDMFVKLAKPEPEPGNDDEAPAKKSLSYWEWIYACLKVLSMSPDDPKLADQTLRKLWGKGRIVGFISDIQMIQKLREANAKRPGTFLLRFSENRAESIGIYYYNQRAKDPLVKISPYTIKDLKAKPLQDRILKSPLIAYLYPDIEKEEAFTRTNARRNLTIDGYVKIEITEYFPSYLVEQFKGVPEQSVSSPSTSTWSNPPSLPSSHSHYSIHSQAASPAQSTTAPSEQSTTQLSGGHTASSENTTTNATWLTASFQSISETNNTESWIVDPANEFSLNPYPVHF